MSNEITAKSCCGSLGLGLLAGAAFVLAAFLLERDIIREFGRRP
jgi:hypothetical protein